MPYFSKHKLLSGFEYSFEYILGVYSGEKNVRTTPLRAHIKTTSSRNREHTSSKCGMFTFPNANANDAKTEPSAQTQSAADRYVYLPAHADFVCNNYNYPVRLHAHTVTASIVYFDYARACAHAYLTRRRACTHPHPTLMNFPPSHSTELCVWGCAGCHGWSVQSFLRLRQMRSDANTAKEPRTLRTR